jgi:hypothetical protein
MERSVQLRSCVVDFGDWSPSGIDEFSDKRKLIAWARPNDQLALTVGASYSSAASWRQRPAHVPVLGLRAARSPEN